MSVVDPALGISTARAKHTGLAIEVRRITSFDTWPASSPRPTVAAVVKAGFFYKGMPAALFMCVIELTTRTVS